MTPGSTSLLCLSCHDGSIAVNSYGNSPAQLSKSVSTGSAMMAPSYQIGTGKYLGNHHPIGFNYGNVQAVDTEIRDADLWADDSDGVHQQLPGQRQHGVHDLSLGSQQGERRRDAPVEKRPEQPAVPHLPRQGPVHQSVRTRSHLGLNPARGEWATVPLFAFGARLTPFGGERE